MSNDKEKKIFEYNYSAPTENEKRQIESIRESYLPKSEREKNPYERIKELDGKVKGFATSVSLVLGVLGTLIFGLGLTMILEWQMLIWGIIVMAVGVVPTLLAYPAYNIAFKRGKEKYGEEILKLSEEILKKED